VFPFYFSYSFWMIKGVQLSHNVAHPSVQFSQLFFVRLCVCCVEDATIISFVFSSSIFVYFWRRQSIGLVRWVKFTAQGDGRP
jgi:hypothetical protein